MPAKLISITPDAEKLISYCARVSNPKNQGNYDTAPKLLRFCIQQKHWSIFEQSNLTVEVITSRAISQQILRHKSLNAQEFSQRYSEVTENEYYEARRQDLKDRQNSIDDLTPEIKEYFLKMQQENWARAYSLYKEALSHNISKESARFLLPLSTQTRLFLNSTIRGWIHYLQVRCGNGTQKEHKDIAIDIRDNIFKPNFPNISEALGW
jgi:thymidylate synthase (FAD)